MRRSCNNRRRRRRSSRNFLDFFSPFHLQAPMRMIPMEQCVPVLPGCTFELESVHIHLPFERGKFRLTRKIPWQDIGDELLAITDQKGIALR